MYIMHIMKIAIICCAFIAWCEGNNTNTRIVGGRAATPGQFPYQAALQRNGKQRCGCVILNRKSVITAGHCIQSENTPRIPAEELTVRAGTNQRYENGQIVQVSSTLIHPNFNTSKSLACDVALVFLETCFIFNDLVQSIPLAKRHVIPGRKLVACGWGATSKGNGGEDGLRYNTLTSVSTQNCFKGLVVHPSIFCVDSPVGNGVCNGDSGSAVAFNGVLIGIISFTRGGCGTAKYDGCAKVAQLRSWIVKNLMYCV